MKGTGVHLLLSAFVACILAGVAGCSQSDSVIRIGAALPFTGTVAYYGQDSKRGIDLALEEINSQGGVNGKKLEVIYEDTQGQGKLAVAAVQKLISADAVPIIIGAGTSTETMAVAPVVERSKTVLLSPVSSAASITNAGDYVFRSVPSDGLQAQDLAAWVLERGFKRVALIYVNQTWGKGLKGDFVREFQGAGGIIADEEATDLDEKDFRTQITKMQATKPDAYVALIYAKEGGLFLKQASELGVNSQIFGADPWTKRQLLETAGEAAEGVLFTTPSQYSGPEYQQFLASFKRKYGEDPGIYEAHGYDCMKLIAKALADSDAKNLELRSALSKTSFKGATGDTTFDQNGDVQTKSFSRMTWWKGSVQPAR